MSITSSDLIDVAKKCITFQSESGFRTSISKSYYAVYHSVCELLQNGPSASHQGVIDYLQGDAQRGSEKYSPKELKALSFVLSNLKGQRKIADYYLNDNVEKDKASVAIRTAEKALERIVNMSEVKIV